MKVMIYEIEEFEVTDPAGLCNPPAPPMGIPIQQQPNPMPQPQRWPTPQVPSPFSPMPFPSMPRPFPPGTGDVAVPLRPAIWTKTHGDPNDPLSLRTKWGVGGDVIQQAGDTIEKEKWERNWQASTGGDVPEDGNRNAQ